MKNQKGVTIVEIVVSVALISIVILFIFNLMVTLKNINDDNNSSSTNIINQNIIIKKVQADFKDITLNGVSACGSDDISKIMVSNYNKNTYYCLKLTYESSDVGYLIYYSYHNTTSNKDLNIIGYSRGANITLRETEIIPNSKDNPLKVKTSCPSGTANSKCALNIIMPVETTEFANYDINLNYIYDAGKVSIDESLIN